MTRWFKRFLTLLATSLALSGGSAFAGPLKDVGEAYVGKKVAEKLAKREIKKKIAKEALVKGELRVGKYEDLMASRRFARQEKTGAGTLDAHHVPSTKYLKEKGIPKNEGVAIEMQPQRHAQTRTYGKIQTETLKETPRDALARDVMDAKKVYNDNGLYDEKVRKSLQEVIRFNKTQFPEMYKK